jgi:phosphatidylglycerol:prolipoprotein diacylglycerol transferase
LFAFAAVLFALFFRNKTVREKGVPLLAVYLVGYGLWRFFIEYARADDRGQTIVSFLSPSQLVSLLMIVGGAVWLVWWLFCNKKREKYSSKN